jgi:DNA-binding CsgD family transcriptional regulator
MVAFLRGTGGPSGSLRYMVKSESRLGAVIGPSEEPEPAGQRSWANLWFEQFPRPHIIISRRLEVLGANRAAEQLLERERAITVRDGLLMTRDRKVGQRLMVAAQNVTVEQPIREVIPGAATLYALRMVALSNDAGSPIAMSLRDAGQDVLACADLSQPFGVTPSEQKIIEALLRGASSQEIADDLDKSVLTIRTHIKRAYAKLSVTNREQLFAKLLPFIDS